MSGIRTEKASVIDADAPESVTEDAEKEPAAHAKQGSYEENTWRMCRSFPAGCPHGAPPDDFVIL